MNPERHAKILIIGSGPAGYTAAIYSARANLKPLLIEGLQPGGQMTITTDVENYPGFADVIQGPWLMEQMRAQAQHVGTEIVSDIITHVDLKHRPFRCVGDSGTIYWTESLIICTGAQARWLGLESEQRLRGGGVSACATCDGFFFRGKEIIVVGGGDSAIEEGIFLTRFATSVTVIHRRDKLRAGQTLQDRAFANEKMRFIWNSMVERIEGGDSVEGVHLRNVETGEASVLETQGVFIFIGHDPNNQIFSGQLETTSDGYLVVDKHMMTSVPGVFAAGEIMDPIYRQVATSVGQGAGAGMMAGRWLEEHESLPQSITITTA
ncbi:MAG: thioredoxin-disulfide reductase [Anaerolineae bacterium]|nr:thioredoxin-disulfide reductase [Anaerolineae bacterium]